MSEEVEFDPDEPLAFGQVWHWTMRNEDFMVIAVNEYTCDLQYLGANGGINILTGPLDPHLRVQYWERLA